MFFEHFFIREVNETNVYLFACLESRRAALVDAGGYDPVVAETVKREGFQVEAILVTHDHYDHTGGLSQYMSAFSGCRLLAGSSRAGGLQAHHLRDGETIEVGSLAVRTLEIHGHTPDSVAFYVTRPAGADRPALSVVFSGDILFSGSVGGTASSRGHDEETRGIRDKIFTLPEATPVYTGHGPATTVGVEKRYNPFFN